MKKHFLMLKQLDRQLNEWRNLAIRFPRPRVGWVRSIRKALGMTTEQLANRLGLHGGRIVQLEHAEVQDAVTLRTLRAAAEVMDCELVYAIVPKHSLEDTLKAKAFKLAAEQVKRVGHSMALEDQAIEEQLQKEQIEQLAEELLEGSLKKLWGIK